MYVLGHSRGYAVCPPSGTLDMEAKIREIKGIVAYVRIS